MNILLHQKMIKNSSIFVIKKIVSNLTRYTLFVHLHTIDAFFLQNNTIIADVFI